MSKIKRPILYADLSDEELVETFAQVYGSEKAQKLKDILDEADENQIDTTPTIHVDEKDPRESIQKHKNELNNKMLFERPEAYEYATLMQRDAVDYRRDTDMAMNGIDMLLNKDYGDPIVIPDIDEMRKEKPEDR